LASKAKAILGLARPFTLLAPLIGFFSGGFIAFGSAQGGIVPISWQTFLPVILGALSAATLNAASNTINQIFDLEIDRINKPARPLPSGDISRGGAWIFTAICYLVSFTLAWLVNQWFLIIVLFTAFVTYAYSGLPFRTKRWGLLANFTIAIPRGCLLVVAGWSAVKTPTYLEPWYLGGVMFLFILGASTTKDFADMKGDEAGGCRTLPIIYGIKTAARMISPSFILPFVMVALGAGMGWLTMRNLWFIYLFSLLLIVWGIYIVWLIVRRPEDLATEANHPSWRHMYLMMLVIQIGLAAAYFM
jgi:geranylgeranylglycerol-phosphate geranylgeranyltransferase